MATTPTNPTSGTQGTTPAGSGTQSLGKKDYSASTRVTPSYSSSSAAKQWPEQLKTTYPDYMEFLAYQYVSYADYYTAAGVSLSSGSSTSGTSSATPQPQSGTSSSTQVKPTTGSTSSTPTSTPSTTTTNVQAEYAGRPTASERFIRGEPKDRIYLPVPNNIQFSDGPSWSTENVGIMGTQLGAIVKSLEGGNESQVGANLQKMAEGLKSEIALKAISETGFFGSAEAITQGIGGKIQNPYTEQIFKGIEPRSFSFNWKLVPRNTTEQTKIDDLIRTFRTWSLPDYSSELTPDANNSGNNLSDRWLTVPCVWNIRFFSGGNEMKYIPLLKVCVIKNISVNFTPDNVWATHLVDASQPAPVAYDLSIEFQEVEIITSAEVKSSGGYGY